MTVLPGSKRSQYKSKETPRILRILPGSDTTNNNLQDPMRSQWIHPKFQKSSQDPKKPMIIHPKSQESFWNPHNPPRIQKYPIRIHPKSQESLWDPKKASEDPSGIRRIPQAIPRIDGFKWEKKPMNSFVKTEAEVVNRRLTNQ